MTERITAAWAAIRSFFGKKEIDGQALIEYALILVLVAIAVIVILGQLGESVNTTFTTVNDALQSGSSGS